MNWEESKALTPLKRDFLEKHGFTFADHFKAARRKEGGLDPAMISFILANVKIDKMPDYLLKQVNLSNFKHFVNDLRKKLANMSFPSSPYPAPQ